MCDDKPATFWRACGFPTKDFAVSFLSHSEEFSDAVEDILLITKKAEKTAMREIKKLIENQFSSSIDAYQSIYNQKKAKKMLLKEMAKSSKPIEFPNQNNSSLIDWDNIKSILIKHGMDENNTIPCLIELQEILQ